MKQVKGYALKGEVHKARLLAQQIARFRAVADRNFASSVMISTEAQLMYSTNKVNKAQVENITGINWANSHHSMSKVQMGHMQTAKKLNDFEMLEGMSELVLLAVIHYERYWRNAVNEGMDDIYESAEDLYYDPSYFEDEVDGIIKESLDSHHQKKDYAFARSSLVSFYSFVTCS